MKKCMVLLLVVILYIIFNGLYPSEPSYDVSGDLLFKNEIDGNSKICIFNCLTQRIENQIEGSGAVYWSDTNLLVYRYNSIYSHRIYDRKEELLYYGKQIDWLCLRNENELSFSTHNEIYLLDMHSKNIRCLVTDNSSQKHGWSPDGNMLYYCDSRGIKCINLLNKDTTYICNGYQPLVSPNGRKLAYINSSGVLCIRDIDSKKDYIWRKSAYNYGFCDDDLLFVESSKDTWRIFDKKNY